MMEDINSFETELLKKMDSMGKDISTISKRLNTFEGETKTALSELSGRIKGNHELITKDLSNYVEKDVCSDHREKQGTRIGKIEERLGLIEYRIVGIEGQQSEKQKTTSEAIIAWVPDLLKFAGVIGAVIYFISKGSVV